MIGAGNVGATTAYGLLLSGLAAEIVLVDVNKDRAEGEEMDLSHASPFSHKTEIQVGDYADCAGASIVIIAAGINQKPGQTRMELVNANVEIFKEMIPQIAHHAPDSILVVATNPVDVLTHVTWKLSGFPTHRVIGSGTALDTARFRYEIGKLYQVNPENVQADIIGEHGDTELPVWSLASISGMRLPDFCRQSGMKYDESAMLACFTETKNAAYKIINRKGWTNYGVATALVRIVETILRDEDTLLPVSMVGNFAGVEDVALSVPSKVTRLGVFHTLTLQLSPEEKSELRKSAESIKKVLDSLSLKGGK